MPPNAPEAAHYKLQLVALQREVDKGKGNSMLYSAYLQVRIAILCIVSLRQQTQTVPLEVSEQSRLMSLCNTLLS